MLLQAYDAGASVLSAHTGLTSPHFECPTNLDGSGYNPARSIDRSVFSDYAYVSISYAESQRLDLMFQSISNTQENVKVYDEKRAMV